MQLNHMIVPARDGEASARWFSELFGVGAPEPFSVFWQVRVDGVDLDFDTWGDDDSFTRIHYAFLVDEAEFDDVFGRVKDRSLEHWADPGRQRPGEINTHNGGRGVYFCSNDGHFLEIMTRPYGG